MSLSEATSRTNFTIQSYLTSIAFGPAQHAERPKGVPAARVAGAAFHLEVHRTRMRVLERPSAVFVAFLRYQIDGLGDALVRREARSAQVVERPQNVVVP